MCSWVTLFSFCVVVVWGYVDVLGCVCVCVCLVRVCGCVYRVGVYVGHVCLCVCEFVCCISISTGKRHFTLFRYLLCLLWIDRIKIRHGTQCTIKKQTWSFLQQAINKKECGFIWLLRELFLTCIQLDVFNLQTPLETKYTFWCPPNKTNKNNQYLFWFF